MKTAYLDECSNVFGRLKPDIRERLEAVLARPNARTWDDAYSIILDGARHTTLWQAWIATDPTAPRSGPVTDQHGKRLSGWARVPNQLALYRAIRYAVRS